MNSIYLVITAGCVFALGYRYYAAFIATKVLMLDDSNITPSHRLNDGCEYVPTKKWILFGHHFAAIAGSGPLVGPILAAQYGWGPGFVWILLGSVFAGGLHDFIVLFASTRHNGKSLAVIARKELGPLAGFATSMATFFIIILALAGFAVVVVNALFNNPWGSYTLFMTVPIAMLIGMYMFRWSPGSIISGSIIGFFLVLGAVFTGHLIPGSAIAGIFTWSDKELSIILPLYGFIAATLPVWLLLAPRDYLSSYMKIGTILALAIGILFVQPQMNMPFATQFIHGGGPIVPGPVWPYVFITIACGAISGFHSLVGSGTTPKMVDKEKQIKTIAYGSMMIEGFVSVMALVAVGALSAGDYFAINAPAAAYAKISAIFPTHDIQKLSAMVGIDVTNRPGGAVSLAVGMAEIFSNIGGLKKFMNYWYQFAIMFEALFILSAIDAGTRVARYLLQDVAGVYIHPKAKEQNWLPGVIISSAIVSFLWGYLVYNGNIATIWPMFGVANQLLGTIALAIGIVIILKINKNRSYALVAAVPFAFMAVTVIAAGVSNISMFWAQKTALGDINAIMSAVLIVLALLIIFEALRVIRRLLRQETLEGLNNK
ncbi:MAG: carbon starvation protein A [Negativicutes bacterium]|jgi:carbon starvation protein